MFSANSGAYRRPRRATADTSPVYAGAEESGVRGALPVRVRRTGESARRAVATASANASRSRGPLGARGGALRWKAWPDGVAGVKASARGLRCQRSGDVGGCELACALQLRACRARTRAAEAMLHTEGGGGGRSAGIVVGRHSRGYTCASVRLTAAARAYRRLAAANKHLRRAQRTEERAAKCENRKLQQKRRRCYRAMGRRAAGARSGEWAVPVPV